MALPATIQLGCPVQYGDSYNTTAAGGAVNQTVGGLCVGNAGVGGAGNPIDIRLNGDNTGRNAETIVLAVPYQAGGATGKWNGLTSASNFL